MDDTTGPVSADALQAEETRLMAEYNTARAAYEAVTDRKDPSFVLIKRRFDNAQVALREAREFWRSVGEIVPEDHDGHRNFIKTTDNDGTATGDDS